MANCKPLITGRGSKIYLVLESNLPFYAKCLILVGDVAGDAAD